LKTYRTVILLTVSVVGLVVGSVAFVGGLWLYDWRLGIAGAGLLVALGSLLIDDGTRP
jgi:hypothetical protein